MKWKISITVFFLILFSFSTYTDPPHDEVYGSNSALSSSIQTKFIQLGNKSTPGVDDPVTFAGAKIITAMPSVDSRISDGNSTIFWVYGVEYKAQFSGTNSLSDERCLKGTSDLNFISYETESKMSFSYNNITKEVAPTSNFVSVPFSKSELQSQQENAMNITVSGSFNFIYNRHDVYQDYVCLGYGDDGGCDSYGCFTFVSEGNFEVKKPFYDSKNYWAENGNVSHFLLAPVLREQWYRNNNFNTMVFSKRRLYDADFKLNGSEIGRADVYNFNIVEDKYGAKSVVSNASIDIRNAIIAEYNVNFTPSTLQLSNNSVSFIYEFNTSYLGIGRNELSLVLKDFFSNKYYINESLLSRKVSFNNVTEGGQSGRENVREGIEIEEKNLNPITVSFCVIGVLVAIFLFNRINRM